MKVLLTLFPACAAFGPLFMVMGSGSSSSLGWIRYLGALMTAFALLSTLGLLSEHSRKMRRLVSPCVDEAGAPPNESLQKDRPSPGR